jgi:hypothetical protein
LKYTIYYRFQLSRIIAGLYFSLIFFQICLQMNQVGLRDIVKSSDARRFELSVTSHPGRSGEVWTMQALSKELKTEWVTRLQKLLIQQLCSIKSQYFAVVSCSLFFIYLSCWQMVWDLFCGEFWQQKITIFGGLGLV